METNILVIVGMRGSGKSTLVEQLNRHGVPKVGPEQAAVSEIEKLLQSGQKRIVLDGVYDWEVYRAVKKQWPGKVTTIAVVAPKSVRLRRVAHRAEHPLTHEELQKHDYDDITQLRLGGAIAVADYYVLNNSTMSDLKARFQRILRECYF